MSAVEVGLTTFAGGATVLRLVWWMLKRRRAHPRDAALVARAHFLAKQDRRIGVRSVR